MGFVFSKSVNDSLKAQQEFMLMNSRLQVTAAVCRTAEEGDRGLLPARSRACAPSAGVCSPRRVRGAPFAGSGALLSHSRFRHVTHMVTGSDNSSAVCAIKL